MPTGGLASASVTFTMPKLTCTVAQDNDGAAASIGVYIDNFDAYTFATAMHRQRDGVRVQLLAGGGIRRAGRRLARRRRRRLAVRVGHGDAGRNHDLTKNTGWSSGSPDKLADTKVDIATYNELIDGLPEANFGKISFTSATGNGDDRGFDSPTRFNSLNGGDTLVKTSALKTSAAGSAFTAQYKKSS